MLIVVNTDKEPASSLFSLANIITEAANLHHKAGAVKADSNSMVGELIPPEDAPDVGVPIASDVFRVDPHPTVAIDQAVLAATLAAIPDPAAVFGSAVVPNPPSSSSTAPTVTPVPSPPTPSPASSAPSAPAPAAPGAVDADGIPWDERIHAGTKSKNGDGRWKKKKGLNDEAMYNRIVAELKAAVAHVPPPPLAPLTASNPVATFPLGPTALAAGVVPPPPVPPAPPAPGVITTFSDLMVFITPLVGAGRVSQAQIIAACQRHNVDGLPTLATASMVNPALVPAILADLKAAANLP